MMYILKFKSIILYFKEKILQLKDELLKYKKLYPNQFKWRNIPIEIIWLLYSFRKNATTLDNAIPWITFNAIKFLKKYIKKDMNIFEYGSGGSTIFFGKYGCKVFSVEHDLNWYNVIQSKIHQKKLYNCSVKFIAPEVIKTNDSSKIFGSYNGNVFSYFSSDKKYENMSFYSYVSYINTFPNNYFDIILIDGRARNACFFYSINKVKDNGIIILDNSDRLEYNQIFEYANDKFIIIEFPGFTPYISYINKTTIFKKK